MSDTDAFVTVRWPDGGYLPRSGRCMRLRLTVGEVKELVVLREWKQTVERRSAALEEPK